MAAALPASLRTPELSRFAHRAAQLEKVKPVIWYWSSYHVLNQILEKGLHTTDADSMAYTTKLMDVVEQFKAANSTNDAITDEIAAKAYVEQFGLDTFTRADNTVRANKATRQTVDTFQAAGTFLDLLAVWGPLEPEAAAKSKYAKYHALRIAKALKAGEDPNLSNPKQQTDVEETLPPLDPNDADVKALGGGPINPRQPSVVDVVDESDHLQPHLARSSSLDQSLHPSRDPSVLHQQRQPSIAEVPDEAHREQTALARQSLKDESLHPSRAPSLPRVSGEAVSPLAPQDAASFYTSNVPGDVSPLEAPSERKPSIGGNYFPVVPQAPTSEQMNLPAPSLVKAPNSNPTTFEQPTSPTNSYLPQVPSSFTSQQQPPVQAPMSPPNPSSYGGFSPPPTTYQSPPMPQNALPQAQTQPQPQPQSHPQQPTYHAQPQFQQYQQQPSQSPIDPSTYATSPPGPGPPSAQYYQAQQPAYAPSPAAMPAPIQAPTNTALDEESMMKAQKHARFAISALNFEDVQTAIRELEGALRVLGAR